MAIASVGFGEVEGFVGAGDEGGWVVFEGSFGEADAEAEGGRFAWKRDAWEGDGGDGAVEALQGDDGLAGGGTGEDEEEFVATVAAEIVAVAKVSGDGVADVADGGIAGGVAEEIVDGFEVVDVDEGDGQGVMGAGIALEFGSETGLDAAAIEGA